MGAGILVNWWRLARPLWVDEEMLLLNVRDRAFSGLVGPLWLDQGTPVGWLAAERILLLIFGSGERAVRLLPILFGMATLLTCVWIGRRWMSLFGAAMLVVLCSLGQWLVFFTLELKHYSADTFFALWLPALAAWALEGEDSRAVKRRIALWWIAAAAGVWFANGAIFVTPGCAVVLFVWSWRRSRRVAAWAAATGIIWLVSFGVDYQMDLRHILSNTYLRDFWAYAFPPASAGVMGVTGWLFRLLEPFAVKPSGTGRWVLFWAATISGFLFAIATRPALGLMLATVPVSAMLLAILRVVPPIERLAIWVVPALYAGVALSADAAVSLLMPRGQHRHLAGLPFARVGASLAGGAAILVCADVVNRGVVELRARPLSNYGLDDQRSVRLLMAAIRPDDVIMTTHFGLPGLWWYGGVDISGSDRGGRLTNGNLVFQVHHVPPGAACGRWKNEMDAVLKGRSRVAIYLGFRRNVEPPGFDNLVLDELGRRGSLVTYRPYAEESRVAIFDLTEAPLDKFVIPRAPGKPDGQPKIPGGCIAVTPAQRW
jgi:hypothetical protein